MEANNIIRLREGALLLDATVVTDDGKDKCESVSHKDEEIGGEWVSLSKTLTAIDVVSRFPINKN